MMLDKPHDSLSLSVSSFEMRTLAYTKWTWF